MAVFGHPEQFSVIPGHDPGSMSSARLVEIRIHGLRLRGRYDSRRLDGFWRLARQAEFGGLIYPGRTYVLVDDFVGMGGTLANLGDILNQMVDV